jgi:WD40 repeat protein
MTCADYKGDGLQFVTGAADTVVRLYDETTR